MAKLNQILAIKKDVVNRVQKSETAFYHKIQRSEPLSGITRMYQPRDDEGEELPGESKYVQVIVQDELDELVGELTRMYDLVATMDFTNSMASADVVLEDSDTPIVENVPAVTLLFLESQLRDLVTIIRKLPILDPADTWDHDPTTGAWRSQPIKTTRSKKVPRNHVKAPATDKHPAQVEIYFEDIVVGDWTTTKFSGAMSGERVKELLARAEALQTAVKFAREKANLTEVADKKIGRAVLGYLFA